MLTILGLKKMHFRYKRPISDPDVPVQARVRAQHFDEGAEPSAVGDAQCRHWVSRFANLTRLTNITPVAFKCTAHAMECHSSLPRAGPATSACTMYLKYPRADLTYSALILPSNPCPFAHAPFKVA